MIRPAVTGSKLGLECERSKARTGSIIKDILKQLNTADVVIADLTDMNPNVFYELGVRHTLQNRTILITQNMDHVPFDLKPYGVIKYLNNGEGFNDFKIRIREILRHIYGEPDRPDNPVADFLIDRSILLSSQEKLVTTKKLTALLAEFSQNISTIDSLSGQIENNLELRKQDAQCKILIARLGNECTKLILTTGYISLSDDTLQLIQHTNTRISSINNMLDCCMQENLQSRAEKAIIPHLLSVKNSLIELLKKMSKIRKDYITDNYKEPYASTILLSDKNHYQFIEST